MASESPGKNPRRSGGESTRSFESPEQLDAMLSIVSPRGWIWIGTIGLVIIALLIWSFMGRITFRATGVGVVLKKNSVLYDIKAPSGGIVLDIDVEVGQPVSASTRLARIGFPARETERIASGRLLREVEQQFVRQQEFMAEDIPRREEDLLKKVSARRKTEESDQQLVHFLRALESTQSKELEKGYITRQQLESTLNQLHQAESSLRSTQNEIRTLETDFSEYVNQQTATLEQLRQQVLETKGSLEKLEVSLLEGSIIQSPVTGTVVEVDVNQGQRISAGAQIVVIEQASEGLQVRGYFDNKDGKKLGAGMKAHVAPNSVERDIYGTIDARIEKVDPVPVSREGLQRVLADPDLVAQMMQGGAPIAASLGLVSDPTTYSKLRWTSSVGPRQMITPGTTVGIRAVVRTVRPIDLVVPLYETWIAGSE
ncbi:NHLP bacteriocin system secretion protein [Myxococcota bacterium]|nr:NHLP bacteriocin system secretion protein [Myxococcota bacterium]